MIEDSQQTSIALESKVNRKRIGAMVMNDQNDLLLYTCRSTIQACEEAAENDEFFANGVWKKIKEKGAKVVQVEVTIIN